MTVSRDILVAPASSFIKNAGWPLFFFISIIAAVLGLFLRLLFSPWNSPKVTANRPGLKEKEDIWQTK
ncbi:MAG: AmpG family muropeptide MFS transporter [Sphaerospermopsis sp. SIO1G2]|nr:AmpG family muropeptide MFS transporter [Sphaerospermopsis sp. SIO1G2]